MKKHKILLAVISALMAVGMIFAAACGGNGYSETQNDEKLALLDLVVDFGAAKSSYNLGDELDTSLLRCSAKLIDIETNLEVIDEDIAEDVVIDDSEFDSSGVGIYNIYVSYTRAGVTRTKSYPVEVTGKDAAFGGIVVEYPAGFVDKVTLQPGNTQTTISAEGIIVKEVDTNGNVTNTLSPSDYDIELYKGTVKQDSWTVGGGAYSIVVKLKSDPKVSNFVSYYVVDDMVSITFNATDSVTSQAIGEDIMSPTWKFIITYNSGVTKEITAADVSISNLDTSRAGSRKAPITYTEFSGNGGTVTVSCRVDYTITG